MRLGIVFEQELLSVESVRRYFGPLVLSAGIEHHRAIGVAQIRVEDNVPEMREDLLIVDRSQRLYPVIEVALHQVGASDVHLLVSAVPEIVNA